MNALLHRRNWLPLHTLSTRIAIPAGFFALVSVAALSFILIRGQRAQVLDEVVHGSEKTAEAILLSLDRNMRSNEREAVRELIERLGGHGDIEAIRVFNKDGEIAYSSRPEEVGRTVDLQAEACVQCHIDGKTPHKVLTSENRSRIYSDTSGRRLLATTHVIHNRADCAGSDCHSSKAAQPVLGVLDVAMSLEPAQARLAAATRNAIVISLIAATLITGIIVLVIMLGTRQHKLNDWARELEQKVVAEAQELREAQFQIVQAEKLSSVGLVAAGIAHELNSPLMAIVTFSHLVRTTLPPESQSYEDLRMIEREANRCAVIIRQLLDYSRKQTTEPARHPCEIPRIVGGAADLLKVELQNAGVHVEITADEDLPPVEANDVQLMQVFVNLLLNAIQAMPQGGHIRVSADMVERRAYAKTDLPPHSAPELVRVRVRDSGTGIAPDVLTRVFDPFFTTKPVGKGSGLGLSVSLGLIRNFRGTILVESDAATWTEFTVLLPVVHQPALAGSV